MTLGFNAKRLSRPTAVCLQGPAVVGLGAHWAVVKREVSGCGDDVGHFDITGD